MRDIIDEMLIEIHNENKILEATERLYPKLKLLESTKRIITEGRLFKRYLAYLLTRYNVFKKPITAIDMRKAIENVLKAQQEGMDWSDEELQSLITDHISDEGIIGSLFRELNKRKIPYILPK